MENGMLKLLILLILLLSFPDETFQFNFRKEKLQFQSFLSKRLHKLPLSKQNAGEIEKPSFLESFIKSQYEISLGAGIMGLVLILLNRSIVWNDGGISVDSFNAVSDIRSRADLIAAIGCTGLLLNIFSDSSEFNFINKEVIDKNIRERDKIALVGHYLAKPLFTALPSLTEVEQERLSWLFEAIQASIPTVTSAHCFDIDRLTVKGVIGVVNLQATQSLLEPDQSDLKSTAKILQSPIAKNEELYLPDLQILPGKIEFTYLPINCQSVFILPLISKKEILVLGTNQAKSLTFDDINKIRVICDLYQDSFTLARSSSLV